MEAAVATEPMELGWDGVLVNARLATLTGDAVSAAAAGHAVIATSAHQRIVPCAKAAVAPDAAQGDEIIARRAGAVHL